MSRFIRFGRHFHIKERNKEQHRRHSSVEKDVFVLPLTAFNKSFYKQRSVAPSRGAVMCGECHPSRQEEASSCRDPPKLAVTNRTAPFECDRQKAY